MNSAGGEPPRSARRSSGAGAAGRAHLASEIDRYVRRGYRVASETEVSVSLVKPKRFGCLPFVVLLLLGIFPAVVYVAWYLWKRDETVYLRLENGHVRRVGGRRRAGETSGAASLGLGRLWRPLPVAAAVAVLVVVSLVVQGGDGDAQPSSVATRAPTATPRAASRTATATPTVPPTPTPAATPETYTVAFGDTLYKIATRFDTTVAELAQLNGISDPSRIEVGQVLVLPLKASMGTPPAAAASPSASASVPAEPYAEFRSLLGSGAGCAELFAARNRIEPESPDRRGADDDLVVVSCLSSSSTREDPPDPSIDYSVPDYRLSYAQCLSSAEQIYAQAGTQDPLRAAEWLSDALVAGPRRTGSVAGCHDALRGLPSQHPR